MVDIDFSKLLNVNTDEIVKPQPLPNGTYKVMVQKHEYGQTQSEKATPFVLFHLQVIEALEDVDPDLLAETLKGKPLTEKVLRHTLYITPDAQFRVKDFLQKCGLETSGRTLGELIPEAQGAVVAAAVTQQPSRKPGDDTIYNVIQTIAAAE